MGLKLKNSYNQLVKDYKKSEDQTSANRSTNGRSDNSLNQNGFTVLVTDYLCDNSINIKGKERTQKGFAALFFDGECNKLGNGYVSPSTLTANLYPNENDAVGSFNRVKGIQQYDTPKAFAEANLSGLVCIKSSERKPACRPIWDDAAQTYTYKGMTKRDYVTFEIVPMPEKLKTELFEA